MLLKIGDSLMAQRFEATGEMPDKASIIAPGSAVIADGEIPKKLCDDPVLAAEAFVLFVAEGEQGMTEERAQLFDGCAAHFNDEAFRVMDDALRVRGILDGIKLRKELRSLRGMADELRTGLEAPSCSKPHPWPVQLQPGS